VISIRGERHFHSFTSNGMLLSTNKQPFGYDLLVAFQYLRSLFIKIAIATLKEIEQDPSKRLFSNKIVTGLLTSGDSFLDLRIDLRELLAETHLFKRALIHITERECVMMWMGHG
jgi:hypothetical protein